MWLLVAAALAAVLRLLSVGIFAQLSWWWIGALFLAAVIWFEFIERYLGLESKRVMNEMEEAKKRRIAEALERDRRMPR